jgi:hypothetical protein
MDRAAMGHRRKVLQLPAGIETAECTMTGK